MPRYALVCALFTVGCAGSAESSAEPARASGSEGPPASPSSSPPGSPSMVESTAYDLHEWGLVSVGPRGFEVAAGPGQRVARIEELTIDKPVLYVHADSAIELQVAVTPGAGLSVAERWPPVEGALRWSASAQPGPCPRPREYPSSCRTPDGYCETAELALYETDDAACLTVGPRALPLLFYRLAASAPPALPLAVRRAGDDVVVQNVASQGALGAVWRVRWDGNRDVTRVGRVDTPAVGQSATLGLPTDSPEAARGQLRWDLGEHGLTTAETQAFMRAWDLALFGRAGSVDEDGPAPVADETTLDVLTAGAPPRGGPRVADAILYWLPQGAITALARVEAEPAPRALRRAMLVRVDVSPR